MKNKWLIAIVLIVALVGLCVASLFAAWQGVKLAQESGVRFHGFGGSRVSAQATEEKSLQVNGPATLNVENSFGNISIRTGTDGQVNVKAEKTAWGNGDTDAQAALKDLKVIIKQDGDTIKISVQEPTQVDLQNINIGPDYQVVKFTISVPKQTAVSLHSYNGDVALDGTTGSADVRSDFGDVTITNVTGVILGESNNGKVTARKLISEDKITLSSSFGAVTLDGATGSDVSVSSGNGQADLKNVKASGLLKASSQFGNIYVANSQAETAEFESNNGALKLEKLDVDGKISTKSDFGDLTLSEVNAKTYDLNTQNGKISLDGCQNAIKAHSDFGSIEVLNARNATIDLSSNNGAVTFSGSLGSGPHIVKSNFGNINMTIPANSTLKVEMQTDFGKITSDFSIAISGEIDSKHWTGTINNGGATLTVKTNNGNITLQSSK